MSRRILITGASRGFGAALAGAFAERAAHVFAGSRGAHPALDAIVHRYRANITPIELDVTDDASVARALSAVSSRQPAIDVLINNAAMRSPTVSNPIESIDFADVSRTLDVNAVGPLRVIKAFLPLLRRADAPVIVNVSSEAGSIGQCRRDREFDYCMSKAALNMATALLANHLRGKIHVFSLHPGWLRTDMGGALATLDPGAVAGAVAERILRAPPTPGPAAFIDHEGRALPW
jgi:NAD(P)-dependent dehydrogenase (short-subunit alcohol dehydrogenase family)